MKRNMDLIRSLLQLMEQQPNGGFLGHGPVEAEGFTMEEVDFHVYLMAEAGLIRATDISTVNSPTPAARAQSITWAGYEFLEASRDPTLWERAKENVVKPAGGLAFSLLTDYLKAEAKRYLGLPP